MSIVSTADGQRSVTGRTKRNLARGLVSDIAVDVSIDDILSRRVESRECLPELLPVLSGIHVKERNAEPVVKRPAQRELPSLARNQVSDDRTVARKLYVNCYVGLALHVNRLNAVLRLKPASR